MLAIPHSVRDCKNMITDCHVHIQPAEMFKPAALEAMKRKRANYEQVVEFCRSPKKFLQHLDAVAVERAVLINYVAPAVMGHTAEVSESAAACWTESPSRLIPCGT